ncbi:MAG: PEP-CTERM sorting domain-containing protein [Myxococcota bacterium]
MRTPAVPLLVVFLLLSSSAVSAPILVNEYNAVSASNFLDGPSSTAADTTLGRIQGNGGDWVELVVIQDHLDLRGGSLSIDEGNAPDRTTTVLSFSQDALWSDLRSGTIITVAEDILSDPSYDPFGGDWWINVQASDTASGQFITASNFSTSNDNTQITLLDALSQVWFGPAGEGIVPASGIGSDEVWKLEADPSASITPTSSYNDGSSSSFGAPNVWSGGAGSQDFAALRSVVVPEPGTLTLLGVALASAALVRQAKRGARSAQ